jgi:hypothetical protein
MKGYEFKYFNNVINQEQFIMKNLSTIVEMNLVCFPHNIDSSKYDLKKYHEMIEIYKNYITNLLVENIDKKWFFVMDGHRIIGYCFLSEEGYFIETNEKVKTYRPIQIKYLREKVAKGPVIVSLCKNIKYQNVGSFLIKNLFIYLKNEEFDYVYLVPGSSYGKNNYEYYIEHSYCTYQDYDKYLVSNIKLLIYYKKLGFKVSKKLYDLDKCNDSEYHLFHVLYKKL